MIKNQQFYVLKLPTSLLKRKKYNVSISFDEAKKSGMIVQLGDSTVLRTIRNITGKNVNYEKLNILLIERSKLRKLKPSETISKSLKNIDDEINEILYIPEYVAINVTSNNQYYEINNTNLYINDNEYIRLLCSCGGARNDTAVFIKKDIYHELDKILSNGAKNIPISPAKYNAYYALCSSASIPVSWINFCVVPDYIMERYTDVEFVHESEEYGKEDTVSKENIKLKFNIWDGMGIISPNGARRWANDLELDYLPSAFCIRNSYLKGMVCVFDIQEFINTVDGANYIVKDVWGEDVDLRSIDMICTESQLKLWSAYDNMKNYIDNCFENNFSFSITRVTPKKDKNYSNLNYQFIQATYQDKTSIKDLCKDTLDYLDKLIYSDSNYLKIYSLGKITQNEEITPEIFNSLPDYTRAILLSDDMFDDPYIKNRLIQSVNKTIRESYIGVLLVNGNFQVAIADPYAFMEYVTGLEVNGLLKDKEHYMAYWNKRDEKTVAAMRAPLTWRSEVNKLNLQQNETINKWYKYLYSGVVYNIWGVDCMLQADSDFDFDIIMTTNNKQIINGIYGGLPITYDKNPIAKEIIDKENLYNYDIRAFNTRIGFITNISTTLYTLLGNFNENTEEYNKIIERLKILRKNQGQEIDRAKGASTKPFPLWWTRNDPDIKMSDKEKEINEKIMVTKRPYFMRYLYPDYNKKYKKQISNFDVYCISNFGYTIDDLKNKVYQTKETNIALEEFSKKSPLIDNDSTMNILCKYMEENIKEIQNNNLNKKSFNLYYIMIDKNISDPIQEDIEKMNYLYKEYIKLRNKSIDHFNINSTLQVYETDIELLKKESFRLISSNEHYLCNLAVLLVYKEFKQYKKDFAWELFGDMIINNIAKNSNYVASIPYEIENNKDNECIDYMYSKYKFKELNISKG